MGRETKIMPTFDNEPNAQGGGGMPPCDPLLMCGKNQAEKEPRSWKNFWLLLGAAVIGTIMNVMVTHAPTWYTNWQEWKHSAPQDSSRLALMLSDRLSTVEAWQPAEWGGGETLTDGTFVISNLASEKSFTVQFETSVIYDKYGNGGLNKDVNYAAKPKFKHVKKTLENGQITFTDAEKAYLQRKVAELLPKVKKRQLDLIAEGLEGQ